MNRISFMIAKSLPIPVICESQIVAGSSETILITYLLITYALPQITWEEGIRKHMICKGFIIQSIQSLAFLFSGKYVKKVLPKVVRWRFIIPVTLSLKGTCVKSNKQKGLAKKN